MGKGSKRCCDSRVYWFEMGKRIGSLEQKLRRSRAQNNRLREEIEQMKRLRCTDQRAYVPDDIDDRRYPISSASAGHFAPPAVPSTCDNDSIQASTPAEAEVPDTDDETSYRPCAPSAGSVGLPDTDDEMPDNQNYQIIEPGPKPASSLASWRRTLRLQGAPHNIDADFRVVMVNAIVYRLSEGRVLITNMNFRPYKKGGFGNLGPFHGFLQKRRRRCP